MKARIALLHANDGTDVRVNKTCRTISSIGFEAHFIGWDRRPKEVKNIKMKNVVIHVMKHQTMYGRGTAWGQFRFIIYSIVMLYKIKPEILTCVNEEATFFFLPFRKILFNKIICEVYDGLYERHSNDNNLRKKLFYLLSNYVRSKVDKIIVTDNDRYELLGPHKHNSVIINNYPEDLGENGTNIYPLGDIKVYVTGSLSKNRGLSQILQAVENIDSLKIIASGWLYDEYATEIFIKHPKVEYRGIVSPDESLLIGLECDAIFVFYIPTTVNNIHASPNKIYDALSIGRPVIINSEVIVSNWVKEKGYGWICSYYDIQALKDIICSLLNEREKLIRFRVLSRSAFINQYSWESMVPVLKNIYQSLIIN